ncbi:multidrug efflux pump [Roseiarcus fermentans]|uniref:Multidrug efflux pump n=1 Tax=Roseiarcus fermentans TaxID=1473586 RepID=A0A366ETK7_9HYPH|nr:efflux RND transporter permease subunit [Roseiarcus fermentans]RBP05030.1 multidrug efflux pump [Roseiarcus fermentans]
MNNRFSEIFIRRPVATTLLTIGVILAGLLGYRQLPVAPLPQIDFPVISVQANMSGASPETMSSSVAAPLERHLGQIADVNEMTSQSTLGSTRVILQFGLDRSIDGAARDVQAAIVAARADLPTSLRQNPSYHKINPADAPIMVLAMTSSGHTPGQLYDIASNVLQQRLSQLPGVGQVNISGSALPAVRIEVNPTAVFRYGIGLEDIRAALASANANSPKGAIEDGAAHYQVYANDQATKAAQYRDLVIAYRNNAAVKLSDVAEVVDSVEDLRNAGLVNGRPGVAVVVSRQPGANIIDVVDAVHAELPRLIASLPGDVDLSIAVDRSTTIRQSLADTQRTLIVAVVLVILVVFAFLRSVRAAAIPSVAVPTSIIGTFGVMYLAGFSLDNLSLMALTISTGFVVDDAIVVLENVSRHLEAGMGRREAAIRGANEVGFTVLSISLSLIAVFAPLIFFGGIVGRLFNEFALTLSAAVMISLAVSLTTTPMMCALILPREHTRRRGRIYQASERAFDAALGFYRVTLRVALRHPAIVAMTLLATIWLNYDLFRYHVSYGLFPVQDTGLIIGAIQADQSISFQSMEKKFTELQTIVQDDPAVANVVGFTGGLQTNSGFIYVSLKPQAVRKVTADEVVNRLRGKLARVAGARLFMIAVSDLRAGGRQSNAAYQYTLLADDASQLAQWTPKLTEALTKSEIIKDVNSDQQQGGLETDIVIDRDTAMRLGLTLSAIDNTLYDAFGQRQVSVIYSAQNQYHVVMEVAPRYWQDPGTLDDLYVSTAGANPTGSQQTGLAAGLFKSSTGAQSTATSIATDAARNLATNALAASGHASASTGSAVSSSVEKMVPLSAFARVVPGHTPLSVNHQGLFPAATISFNLAPGKSLSQAQAEIDDTVRRIGMPSTVRGAFAGTAATFQQSQSSMPMLFGAALLTIYIVLGILYESLIHPLTILSTLFSASVGAALALWLSDTPFTVIAAIGVLLLIGVVKKNAIMMVDFALDAERRRGLDTREAIEQACLMRFRPIMMTTFAAIFGALPLAFGTGEGSELRHPLGITIVGGLIVSQALTLYTTPVVFIYLDSLGKMLGRLWNRYYLRGAPAPLPDAR